MKCDLCKTESETLFFIRVLSRGEKAVCAKCYELMFPKGGN